MLKYINYQLLDDEEQQKELERAVAPQISRNIRQNIDAFRQYIPSVLQMLNEHEIQQFSLFCTAKQQLNIVDFATGRVFYTENPQQEVADELSDYFQHASYFCLRDHSDAQEWRNKPLPAKVDVMLVFGMGLGLHLLELISSSRIRFMVIYEPSADVFACSAQAADWREILDTAHAVGTHIFLQIGSEANSLPAELQELLDFAPEINEIFVYRHQFHPMMDDVIAYVMKNHGNSEALLQNSHIFTPYKDYADYVAERAGNVIGSEKVFPVDDPAAQALYEKNMAALATFYPKVHKELLNHKTRAWQLVTDSKGNLNLYHQKRHGLFHHDLTVESTQLVDYFIEHPFKDDVVLSQRTSYKFRNYLHFSKIVELQPLIEKILTQQSKLPEQVETLIVFGIGLGQHIELLTKQRNIKNLFLCEPNLDFFAASLWVTDWAGIIEQADNAGGRIYLNLGGDGSHYFYDLMSQFYQVGAYSIADTYMLSTYYNVGMQKAIADLRAELRVVLAMGEYYDHARFGIAHSYQSLHAGQQFLKNANNEYKHLPALNLPVFIIGNGPSLDHCFDYLKEYRDQVILISCGTALRSLHKHDICPDFHAEIEQNRATYDWVTQINDANYLKRINLLSVNGIHPDTSALFKATYLCFKDGEASTYIFHNGMKKNGYKVASLAYAYPTVTNMVMNYAIKLGWKCFYLFGVDLGFVDINQHHSQHSSYYKADGSQAYDYKARHGGGVPAPGNFRAQLYTKPEFDVSRKLIEQAISKAGRMLEVYNCSDGVKIKGTVPLLPENILLENSSSQNKDELLAELFQEAFYPAMPELADKIYRALDPDLYNNSMQTWLELLAKDATDISSARALVNEQWNFMRSRAVVDKDITFCLFHGSSNFIAAVLTKIAANISTENDDALDTFNQVLAIWRDYLEQGRERYLSEPLAFDAVCVSYLFTPPKAKPVTETT